MIGNSLLTQIGIIAISFGVILVYIKPSFGDIDTTKDNIAKTEEQLANVKATNDLLNSLYLNYSSISQGNKNALFTYLPDSVDEILIMKDLTSIAKDAGILITDISSKSESDSNKKRTERETSDDSLRPQNFVIDFSSSYEQLKNFLQRLEQNNYPLVVDTLTVAPTSSGFLNSNITIIAYSYKE